MKQVLFLMLFICSGSFLWSQEEDTAEIIKKAEQFIATGNDQLVLNGNFPQAEADYRKAIHTNPESTTAKYNLANAYYTSEKYDEATQRFKEAIKIAKNKDKKHKAFHNLGNAFMEQKKYKEAVEAYKNALRNNSTDEETRYNLALAKQMLKQQEQENEQNKDDQKDQDQDQKDQNEENKDSENKEGDNKEDQKNQEEDGDGDKKEDKGDQGKSDEEKEGEEKEGEDGKPKDEEEKEGGQQKEQDQKEGEGEQQPAKPVPGQLSPQQVKNLLEAMNNQEKKVQGKINAEKVKGAKVRTEKDW